MSAHSELGAAPNDRVRRYVAWAVRNGWWLWLLAVLLAVPAAVRTVKLYANLKSDVEELLPRNAPSVAAIDELRARMPGVRYLGVLVDVGKPENLAAGERLLDDLAARVGNYPKDLVASVRTGVRTESEFLRDNAPLYVDLADLKTIKARIIEQRDREVSKSLDLGLGEADDEPLDFSDLQKKYQARGADRFNGGRFSNAEQHLTLMLIEVAALTTGSDLGNALFARVQADLRQLGGTDRYAPGMRVGYTGDVAIDIEELAALVSDLSVSSVVVIVLTLTVILVFFRWYKSVFALLVPLTLATLYAFALVTLPPASIDGLNSNTAFLASVIVGNGVNFGVILLARYVEERRRGQGIQESLATAIWGARSGTVVAALAAATAYGSLMLTQFRGFHQFGVIGALGMLACWAMAFVLGPSLIAWLDRDGSSLRGGEHRPRIMGYVAGLVQRHPTPIVLAAALVTALSLYRVRTIDGSWIEYDFSQLRRSDSRVSGEAYWGHRMDELLGRYLTPLVVLTDSPQATARVSAELKASAATGVLAEYVSEVRDAHDVLPSEQSEKLAEVAEIREILTPRLRAALSPEQRSALEPYLGDGHLHVLRAEELPHTLTAGLRERNGRLDRAVLVYPKPSDATWHGAPLAKFTNELRRIGGSDARPAGSIPLSADIIASISRDGPLSTLVALAGVVLLVAVIFRFNRATLLIIGSLLLGVLWLTALTLVLNVKVNFCNFIAFPITFGIGVDYAVNVMARYRQTGSRDVIDAIRSTGGAVAVCSLTTIIGYGSLLLAKNQALFLFGVVAVLGEITCLIAAVVVLPAVLSLRSQGADGDRRLALSHRA
ncbi:MAG TPA: MMPL family transporter [Polyangiaceae bacterium]|nr:MMPL family transporter [Polyangiaceae bacterium]